MISIFYPSVQVGYLYPFVIVIVPVGLSIKVTFIVGLVALGHVQLPPVSCTQLNNLVAVVTGLIEYFVLFAQTYPPDTAKEFVPDVTVIDSNDPGTRPYLSTSDTL